MASLQNRVSNTLKDAGANKNAYVQNRKQVHSSVRACACEACEACVEKGCWKGADHGLTRVTRCLKPTGCPPAR